MSERLRRYRHRLLLQQPARTLDALGGYVRSWNDVAIVWAEMPVELQVTESRIQRAGQPAPHHQLHITVRRRADFAIGQRLVWGARRFLIRGIEDDNEGYGMNLIAREEL